MSGLISTKSIIDACNAGVERAYNTYLAMTGNCWLWLAPEYFITTMIALELNSLAGSKYVTMEHSAYDVLSNSEAIGRGKLHREIRANGRIDILLWWGSKRPRAIIEVKNRIYNKNQYTADIKRIKNMLNRKADSSSLRFGIFSFYTESKYSEIGSAKVRLDKRLNTIESNIKEIIGEDFSCKLYSMPVHSDDDNSWCAASVLIKRR